MGSCRILLLVSLIWTSVFSKSISSNHDESIRKSRQLDFGECCPCPKPEDMINNQKSFTNVMSSFDDCPCRNRAPDIEAASSILTPALQALRPLLRTADTKAEPDPLLKPEVGLASSVLETLQEVTNEEYQNALARDATRSVAKALETDLMEPVDSPGNIINIILNPKDKGNDFEVLPEASHIQETRCIHSPLGSTSNYNTNNLKSSYYREPKHRLQSLEKKSITGRKHFDMDNEASNIHNSIQKPYSGHILKSLYEKQDQNELTKESQKNNSFLPNDNGGNSINSGSGLRASSKFLPKVPDLKLASLVDNFKKSIQSNSILNQITNKNIPSLVRNIKPNVSTTFQEKVNPETKATLKPFLFNNNLKKPMTIRNILKLKDVELIPIQNTNKNIKVEYNEPNRRSLQDNDDTQNVSVCKEGKSNDEESHLHTEVLDAEPSSSNIKVTSIESQSSDVVTMKNALNHSDDVDFTTVFSIIPTSPEINLNQNFKNDQDESSSDTNRGVSDLYFADSEDYISTPLGLKTSSEKNNNVSFEETTDPCIVDTPLVEEEDASSFIRNDESTKKNKNTLPLIRADILKSFESFKKVNDNMQQKLRQNLQNVLKLVDKEDRQLSDDENHEKYMRTSVENTSTSNTKYKEDKNITLDDLQKMSDSILHSSELRNDELEKDSNESTVQDSDLKKPVDCVGSQSIAQKDEISNDSAQLVKNDVPLDSLESSTYKPIIIKYKSKEYSSKEEFDLIKAVNDDRENSDILNLNQKSNNENEIDMDNKDLPTGMSENIESIYNNIPLSDTNNTFVSNQPLTSHNEKGCEEGNLNEMSVQASEPVANRAVIQPGFGRQKTDRNLNSKYSLSSALKPYSTKVTSPDFLNRDYLHQNLGNKIKSLQVNSNKENNDRNHNLQSIFRKTDKDNRHSDILVSDPSETLGLISDNFKSRREETLKQLNHVLGMGKNTDVIKSNGLFEDALSNSEDIKRSFSQAHNDLSDRLQELRTDWNDKIKSINERANNLDRPKLSINRAANARTSIIESKNNNLENKLKQSIPTTLTNAVTKGKPINLQHSLKPLSENMFLAGKDKSLTSKFTTTMQPFSIFTTKIPQMKGIISSPPKPTLSQTIKNALESAPSNKLKMKIKDLKTLPSTIDTVTSKSLNNVLRLSKPESQETIEMENASLKNKNNILPNRRTNPKEKSKFSNNINTPFQLKAEESTLLQKLLEGIRSSQTKSDKNIMVENYLQDEGLQSPSRNIEKIEMPGNTLKENISYKCKMVCTKDDK